MKKNYVLDTNVLLHDPYAIFKFEDNDLILPIYVIEEIDTFKRENTERGRNARTISRLLDALRERGASLARGVRIGEDGSLRVHVPEKRPHLAIALHPESGDHAIMQTALDLRDASPERPTIFVTMDVNLRIRADALGLTTEAYENQSVDVRAPEHRHGRARRYRRRPGGLPRTRRHGAARRRAALRQRERDAAR